MFVSLSQLSVLIKNEALELSLSSVLVDKFGKG